LAETRQEERLNGLLREVDWRFLLRLREAPRVLDLSDGSLSEALELVAEPAQSSEDEVDLVLLGFPGREELKTARARLRDGGELVCLWHGRRPRRMQRAQARLTRAGFEDVHFYWPGPENSPSPEFWLPLGTPAAIEQAFSQRPLHSRRQAASRLAWRLAARFGAIAPLCATARLPGPPADPVGEGDGVGRALPAPEPWLLLTGGSKSENKVVGLPFPPGRDSGLAAKFGRVERAETALDREAEILRRLGDERPSLSGAPWVRASGERAGQRAIVQKAMGGRLLSAGLSEADFSEVAPKMTGWLLALAGEPQAQPASAWSQRLLFDPLDRLERDLGDRLPAGLGERARRALSGLDELPLVWEHRDLGPWNVVLGADGSPGVIDWEDAEPLGLPGLDLVYFLTTYSLLIEGALDDTGDSERIVSGYRRLLDPQTTRGKIAAGCLVEYRERLGVGEADLGRLRLLCWIVQALIAGGDYFLDLATDELERIEAAS
jgi:hypothetical protein